MREASFDREWLATDNNQLLGIALGYDYCAEHEWGTSQLQDAFGLPSSATPEGLEDRRVTQVPHELIFATFEHRTPADPRGKAVPAALLVYQVSDRSTEEILSEHKMLLHCHPSDKCYRCGESDTVAAWDAKSFAIGVMGEALVGKLAELYRGFLDQDVIFGAGLHGGWAKGRGLTFVLGSRCAQGFRAKVLEDDREYKRLLLAAQGCGIEKRLLAAKKAFMTLKPHWADEAKSVLKFWLNPVDHQYFNAGWYSVQELLAWTSNQGPVLKKAA